MLKKKFMCVFFTAVIIFSSLSLSAFAAESNPSALKKAADQLRSENSLRQQSLESLKQSIENERTELGLAKLNPQQKEQINTLRLNIKEQKQQIELLKQQLGAARKTDNSEEVKRLLSVLKSENTKLQDLYSSLSLLTGISKDNISGVKELRTILSDMHNLKKPLLQAAEIGRASIKALYSELKAARKANDNEAVKEIIAQLVPKLEEQTVNIIQRRTINNNTVQLLKN